MSGSLSTRLAGKVRTLALVLGDQLDRDSTAIRDLDAQQDAVLMLEVAEEATHVRSHKQRTALFLAAMRHFGLELQEARGLRLRYVRLDSPGNTQNFGDEVGRAVETVRPERLRLVQPGEQRVARMVQGWSRRFRLPVEITPDTHFLTSQEGFDVWARGRKTLQMERFYRWQRKRLGVLVDAKGNPEGGQWNFDAENRRVFGKAGPQAPAPRRFRPDVVTQAVLELVRRRFPDAPGQLEPFQWPVTRKQALAALRDFITKRLPAFGPYQDAMWTDEPFLHHSLLSPALNLKLLHPQECIDAAIEAWRAGQAPLASVEGFVRQILGWREFIRGVYWHEGPDYGERNGLSQHGRLPPFYWTGDTDMACMRQSLGQVLEHAYGHHIQRLMVTGNFALIAGVHPRAISDWYLGMYVDAVDWVTLPNTLGMVMHADARRGEVRGVVGTKPYAASGAYIRRMSNYCRGCSYDPKRRAGAGACPFTVFYWDFLARNRERLARNPRMAMAWKNLQRLSKDEGAAIRTSAEQLRQRFDMGSVDR